MAKLFVSSISLTILSTLAQVVGTIPDVFADVARNAPALVVVVWGGVHIAKMVERLAAMAVDESERNREHLTAMMAAQRQRDTALAEIVNDLAKQVAMNTAVVAQATSDRDVLNTLIDRAFPERERGGDAGRRS